MSPRGIGGYFGILQTKISAFLGGILEPTRIVTSMRVGQVYDEPRKVPKLRRKRKFIFYLAQIVWSCQWIDHESTPQSPAIGVYWRMVQVRGMI